MKKTILLLFVVNILIFTSFFTAISQTKAPFTVEKMDGIKYYLHTVEQGHTLYAISKQYSISIADIIEANPEAKDGLIIGQVLKIPLKKVDKKESKNNTTEIQGNHLLHIVQQGETLYGISKKYAIKIDNIVKENPDAESNLKIGDTLKISVFKVETTEKINIAPAIQDTLLHHMVKEEETLYSLAKLYNVNIDSIRIVNNGLPDGLKVGQSIRIPKRIIDETSLINTSNEDKVFLWKDTLLLKESYNVALMLPFYLSKNDALDALQGVLDKPAIFEDSYSALTFYEGVMVALDSLNKSNSNVRLFVYDTEDKEELVRELLLKPEMEQMHLIIGPLFKSSFDIVSEYAKKQGINVVCPVPQSNKILLGNPHVSKVHPSLITQMEQTAEFIFNKYYNENIILINNDKMEGSKYADIIKSKGIETLAKYSHLLPDTIKELNLTNINLTKGKQQIIDWLSVSKKNIIFFPSSNQVMVSDLLTRLDPLTKDFQIIIIGMEKWRNFENIDAPYLHHLNIHFPSFIYINYDDFDTKSFIRKFRETYKTEPDKYAFLGFDIMYYYANALRNFGATFTQNLPELQFDAISISFDYFKTNIKSGYENKHVFLLKYEEYKLVKEN